MNEKWDANLKFVDVGNNAAKMTALLGEQTDVINISYALATDYFSTGEFIPLCLLGAEKNDRFRMFRWHLITVWQISTSASSSG